MSDQEALSQYLICLSQQNGNSQGNATKVSSSISSVEQAWWIKRGYVVQFYVVANIGSFSGLETVLFSGFPTPQSGLRFTGMVCNKSQSVRVEIDYDGNMKNAYTPDNVFSYNVLQVSGTYLTA